MIGNYSIPLQCWSLYIWNSVLHVIMFYEEFDKLDCFLKKMLIMYDGFLRNQRIQGEFDRIGT